MSNKAFEMDQLMAASTESSVSKQVSDPEQEASASQVQLSMLEQLMATIFDLFESVKEMSARLGKVEHDVSVMLTKLAGQSSQENSEISKKRPLKVFTEIGMR